MANKSDQGADPSAYIGYPGPSGTWSDQYSGNRHSRIANEDTGSIIQSNRSSAIHGSVEPTNDDAWNSRNEIVRTLDDYRQTEFDDVMKQPSHPLTIPGINTFFSRVYTYTQAALYTILTLLTGMFITLAWALVFGAVSYINIWLLKPALRLAMDILLPCGHFYRFVFRMLMDPVFESIGRVYSYMHGNFKLSVTGLSREKSTNIQSV